MSDESPEHMSDEPPERHPYEHWSDSEPDVRRAILHFGGGLMLYIPLSIVGFGVMLSLSLVQTAALWFTVAWALIVFALAVGLYRARKPWLAIGLLAGYALAGLLSGGMCIFLP